MNTVYTNDICHSNIKDIKLYLKYIMNLNHQKQHYNTFCKPSCRVKNYSAGNIIIATYCVACCMPSAMTEGTQLNKIR